MTNEMMRQRKYLFIVSEGKVIQMFCIRVSSTKAIKEAKANDPLDYIHLLWFLLKSLIFHLGYSPFQTKKQLCGSNNS